MAAQLALGGTLPGEALMPNPKVPHPQRFYTPIADTDDRYVAEPVSFGMRFARGSPVALC